MSSSANYFIFIRDGHVQIRQQTRWGDAEERILKHSMKDLPNLQVCFLSVEKNFNNGYANIFEQRKNNVERR